MEHVQPYMTRWIADMMDSSGGFMAEIQKALSRYITSDWGALCREDWELNDYAVQHEERILGAYETSKGKVYIITE